MKTPKTKKPSNYQVGYGKPPKHTQFKPGQSGNPLGKPKGRKSAKSILLQEAGKLVSFEAGGAIQKAPKLEVVVRQLFAQALKGDPKTSIWLLSQIARIDFDELQEDQASAAGVDKGLPELSEEALKRTLRRFKHLLDKD